MEQERSVATPPSQPQQMPSHVKIQQTVSTAGKFFIAFMLIVILGVLGYTLGSSFGKKAASSSPTPNSVSTNGSGSTTTQTAATTPVPVSSGPLEAQQGSVKTAHAGMQTGLFSPYSLTMNPEWTQTHTTDTSAQTDRLVISKDNYSITILQASAGSGKCIYPGDAPQDGAQSFTSYAGIPGIKSQYRRGTNDGTTYTICEKHGDSYVFPTSSGFITYTTPNPADISRLNEMDAMVASLTK